MSTFSLTVVNNDQQTLDFVVYKPLQGAFSLAWLVGSASAGAMCTFRWTVDYAFVLAETGLLRPGVIFTTRQLVAANLETANTVTLTENDFEDLRPEPPAGSLKILMDGDLTLPSRISVGVAQSDSAVYAVQAQPNIVANFTPHPTYWLAFGQFVHGQALDLEAISPQSVRIAFPVHVYTKTATLGAEGRWTVR